MARVLRERAQDTIVVYRGRQYRGEAYYDNGYSADLVAACLRLQGVPAITLHRKPGLWHHGKVLATSGDRMLLALPMDMTTEEKEAYALIQAEIHNMLEEQGKERVS